MHSGHAPDTAGHDEAAPPFVKRWSRLYAVVILELVAIVAVLWVLERAFR